jgi:glucosamine--fructose-6-phosphate aminotransferase (isomerizing)
VAGPEIAVASTKAYTTQMAVLALLACYFSQVIKREEGVFLQLLQGLRELPNLADAFLASHAKTVEEIARLSLDWRDAFFIGRGLDWAIAQEGSLKLKEVSYIHSEAYAAGELKHGTLALIEEGVPVIGLVTQQQLVEKTVSNIWEAKSRGAAIYAITQFPQRLTDVADAIIPLPRLPDPLMPILAAIPTQLLAYYAAAARGLDVDKPRNLAKSVTVE